MLPKVHRISAASELVAVVRRGTVHRSGCLTIRALPTSKPTCRFAFVVSNRVSKRATKRNRLRRQLRGIVQAVLARLPPGCDVVVTVRPGREAVATTELRELLERGLRRLHILQ